MRKLLEFLKRIFSRPEDKMSDSWLNEHISNKKEEFHSVCWNWPVVKDF